MSRPDMPLESVQKSISKAYRPDRSSEPPTQSEYRHEKASPQSVPTSQPSVQ
ncbi:hypothetical protein CNEO3_1220002 [Clostridium neonatale]|nr:hypothetical protein CNEO3_1220002 [Clostridium neonatale]CAI3641292.1 hypothetical protein CNEO3_70119 [Clostridium neonatale]